MNNYFPKILTRFSTHLVYIFSSTGYFLISILLYEPRAASELLMAGDGLTGIGKIYPFNLSITCAIILVCLFITRIILYCLRKRIDMGMPGYIIWCIGEIVIISAFIALYTSLMAMGQENYFVFLGRSFKCIATLLVYPYSILTLSYSLYDSRHADKTTDDQRMKFYDNRHLLKLVALKSSILYIEAQENYLHIHYLENGREKTYELRNSMRSIETLCEKSGFVRSHRSYIVNPDHVKLVAKGADGHYFASMDTDSDIEIPVSRKYHANIISLL